MQMKIPGSFPGFLKGTNLAPIANAMGGPKMNPRASTPARTIESSPTIQDTDRERDMRKPNKTANCNFM